MKQLISVFHRLVLIAVIFANILLGGTVARGQGIITGSISGTVVDSTGAVIPAASVTVTDLAKGTSFNTKTQSDGNFAFPALPIGTYSLTITSSGFATTQIPAVSVVTGVDHSVGKQLLGVGASTTVTVESQAGAQIETVQSQVTTTFDTQQLTNLPTAGGFDELALLIPGVVDVHADNFSNTNGVGISVNGERGRANNFELDGQSNNDNSIGGPQVFFGNDEALAQVQIVTDNFAAQYGRNAGSVVNYITKSGTNSIHGSVIYKYSGDFTSSLDTGVSKGPQFGFCAPGQNPNTGCTPPVVPRYVSNWYGGTLGFPIIKDKLWAFGSTYWNRQTEFGALDASPSALFPTQAGLASLAAAFPNNPGVAVLQQLNPYAVTTGNPRQLPTSASSCPASLGTFNAGTCIETVASGGKSLQIPFSNFGRQVPFLSTDQEDLGRIDWQATSKDRFYARYFYQKNPTSPDGATANGGYVNVEDAVHSVGADLSHIFSPRWVNQVRYSFQQSTLAFEGGGFTNCIITNFATCPSNITFSNTAFSGLGLPNNLPQGRIVKVGQVQDNATWTFGQHAITFGGEFDYNNSPNVFLPNASATFGYDNLNDFITGGCPAGACSASLAIGNPTIPFKEQDVALYFQDDWKVTPSLTLNLGLRWEFFQQAINLLHRESVANQTGPDPLWNTALPLSVTTLPAIPNYYKNIEPRFGFAWNPDFNKKLAIRGGYAINVEPAFYNINLNVAANAPLVSSGSVNCTGGTVQCIPTGGATFATVQAQTNKLLPTGGSPGDLTQSLVGNNFHNPQGQTYSLGAQYQIRNSAVVEVRYVGNHTSSQFQDINANPFLGNVAAAFPNVVNPSSLCTAANSTLPDGADIGRLNCGSSLVSAITNTAFSQYNSVQTSLTTRNYRGVTATFAFTHSKNIDNTSEIFGNAGTANEGGNTIALAQNPLDIDRGERAVSGIDLPNAASISFTYTPPAFHTGKDLLNKLTNGWQANTIWVYNSGQPYTNYQGVTTASSAANPDDNRTLQSYNDTQFNNNQVGFDVQRPILSNKNAPLSTLGIYTDTTITAPTQTTPGTFTAPQLVDYVTGNPVSPSQVHFIANNQLAANILGNPYPGIGRNTLRGDTFNNADFSVFKNTKINERLTFRLEVDAFNVLNRSYYGTPGANLGDANTGNFNNYLFNAASGSAVAGFGTGVRNMIFSGKLLF
jgi:Carboxypeptidase regulatory-like domain/TonB-dependent Receptor Plug Domain/TonB dependent receptor